MNAKGQYVGYSLLELGTSRATISANTFNGGNDPGAQGYTGIIIYGSNVSLSGNTFNGTSAYGDSIRIYPQTNSSNLTISGGSINIGNSFGAQIISQKPGTGYSGVGDCSVEGGVYTAKAKCTATVSKQGGLVFAITFAGSYSTPPTAITTSLTTHGTTASVQVGRAHNQAVAVACNQNKIPLHVTGIAGTGATGPVTSVSPFQYPGPNAQVGGGFAASSGMAAAGGSGTGLRLDIQNVDRAGGITSVRVSNGGAGSGYKVGDTVFLPITGSQIAAEVVGLKIGGGLTISGAPYHAIDIQGFQGTNCPVSASLDNVTISGPDDTTGIVTGVFHKGANVNLAGVRFAHVMKSSDGDR
jgi:hypothetical protein